MVNKVTLLGRVGQDPEVKHLESGQTVAKFSIATTEKIKMADGTKQERTEWHDVVCWRRLAEIADQYLSKGKLVYIEGKLTHRKWEDKDGNNRKTTEVLANTFQMLDKADNTVIDRSKHSNNEQIKAESNNFPDDDLPF